MKFVCLKCETYMTFEKVEKPAEGSLGVFFECPSCQSRFSMVTNPGETQMVSSLGVQLGGRTEASKPLEMTRGGLEDNVSAGMGQMAAYLNEKIQSGQPAAVPAASGAPATASEPGTTSEGGGCPFSAMVAQMGLGSTGTAGAQAPQAVDQLLWTSDAQEKLAKLPSFVQPMVKSSVETYARKNGFTTVTLQVMDDSKNASTEGIKWTPEAQQRLDNIPDFIRPMARREIERLVKERGQSEITAQVMEEAKEKFMKFM
ncbi:PCP reductase family protein [Candidatus Nitrospira allomarina]|jgi:proto-chlorophyllide reductase subunit|uniref:PCP reductase family protein n=1 Tax=Candidatus Nitrospira allomarina TaxID=3020900 RepID=A0AA96JZP9_9BACT|nr:PCP reductase family protein [Candidatus Nitrospira allomarina]WNM58889.1 PCP reductase family protein [Candidatus Nitrospira allomarina]